MKHFISILLFSCVFTTGIHAQDFKRHEIAFYLSTGDAANEEFGNFIYDVEQKTGYERDFLCGVDFYPILGIEYFYNFTRKWSVGLSVGFGKTSEGLDNFCMEQELRSWTNAHSRLFYVMPEVRRRWYQTQNGLFSVYSKIALGYARQHNWLDSDSAFDEKKNGIAYQITAGGIEFGSKRWPHLYSELGYGHQGIFVIGIKLGL